MKRLAEILLLLALAACSGGHEVDFERSLAVPAPADLVLRNGKIITVDRDFSIRQAVAIRDGRFVAVGSDRDVRVLIGRGTRFIELGGRTVIPGLIDSHIYATEAALSWDAELRWERMRSLSTGLKQIAAATQTKPPGSWIVVGGGWVPTQFSEKRFPTRAELDQLAPNHPVYIQYLYEGALLNSAALNVVGIAHGTPDPAGGKFERNPNTGELTGWLQGVAAWQYVYNKIPRPSLDKIHQSMRNCFRELNRLGITSVGDLHISSVTFAHRRLLAEMARSGDLTLRLNFYLAVDDDGEELEQLKMAIDEIKNLPQSDMFRFVGLGKNLVRTVGDTELMSNPKGMTITAEAKEEFRRMLRLFAGERYGFHLRAGQNSTARQWLDVLEEVNAATPFSSQRIAFAQLEDATPETIARIKMLGGGMAVQDRMALTGERTVELWGMDKARNAPPLRTMIESGIAVGAGTGAFRSANYSPMLSLWWLITGKTVAGSTIRNQSQNLTRAEALRLYTIGSAWFTFDEGRKGSIEVGKLADLAVLNGDYLTVSEDQIRSLESMLTLVGGRIVYAAEPFTQPQRK
ncbi:MAG TPA: amidohydrolase [Candidatus Binatia bacterium]